MFCVFFQIFFVFMFLFFKSFFPEFFRDIIKFETHGFPLGQWVSLKWCFVGCLWWPKNCLCLYKYKTGFLDLLSYWKDLIAAMVLDIISPSPHRCLLQTQEWLGYVMEKNKPNS